MVGFGACYLRLLTPVPHQDGDLVNHQAALAAAAELLTGAGAPPTLAGPAVAHLGLEAAALLAEDPWALLAVENVRPEQADALARARISQVRPDDPRRTRALACWLLERAARDGHTAMGVQQVLAAFTGIGVPNPRDALVAALEDGSVLAFADSEPDQSGPADPLHAAAGRLCLERYALAEETVAESVRRLLATRTDWPGADQRPISDAVLAHGLVVVRTRSGYGPLAVELAELAEQAGCLASLITPTANYDGLTGLPEPFEWFSLRRWLGEGPDPQRPLLVLAAEAHALDAEATAALLETVPDGSRVVLAGDPDQLRSAGAGDVLADLVASGGVQVLDAPGPGEATDPLATLVAAVRDGRLPAAGELADESRRVVVVGCQDAAATAHRAVQVATDSLPRVFGTTPDQVAVVGLRRRGPGGTHALNRALRATDGPADGGLRAGDQVVVDRSVLTEGLVAGERGRVELVEDSQVVVDLGDGSLTLDPVSAGQLLRPGWALTARQALGSRWQAAVVALPGDAAGSLSRELLVSAFTRGRAQLTVVTSAGPALAAAVAAPVRPPRLTRLAGLLR